MIFDPSTRVVISATTHLLSLAEWAQEFRVGETTLDGWVYGKKPCLASFKRDKIRRVSMEEATRFVLANTVRPDRPDWLTLKVESDFKTLLRQEVQAAWFELQRKAA